MDWKRLITNALLAGLWAGLAVVAVADQPLSKAVLVAAITAAIRGAIGAAADVVGKPVPVDTAA
jgi:hypothetical protein